MGKEKYVEESTLDPTGCKPETLALDPKTINSMGTEIQSQIYLYLNFFHVCQYNFDSLQ
jgi:hypothetical protein